jgi:ubiquinone/menaquinone biosynthesis C-methylase UbiE
MMTAEAKFWDRAAETYAAQPVKDVAAFERKQKITRDYLRPDSTVVEIGCGSGSLALAMSPFAGHIHAMDVSAEMVRIANRKKEAQRVTNVTFHQGTLDERLPFGMAEFDGVWAYNMLHLIEDRRRTLKTLFELLKPGGAFISSNVCLGGSWVPWGAIVAVMHWFGRAPKCYVYDRTTILGELREAGFVDVEEKDVGARKMIAFIVAKKPA